MVHCYKNRIGFHAKRVVKRLRYNCASLSTKDKLQDVERNRNLSYQTSKALAMPAKSDPSAAVSKDVDK